MEMTDRYSAGPGVEAALSALYADRFGVAPESVVALSGAGSDRKYYRLVDCYGTSVVGVCGPDEKENRAFIGLSGVFSSLGLDVPAVYGASSDMRLYLEEDLGDTSLYSLLGNPESDLLVETCMKSLAAMQTADVSLWRDAVFVPDFGRRQVMWDLNYFKYDFLKLTGVPFSEAALEDDFERMALRLGDESAGKWGFMLRDCQSRNVMVRDSEPYWIDFQGGMRGPALYDAVSFLWQVRAGFSPEFRRRCLDVYADEYCQLRGVDKDYFLSDLDDMVLFRTLQVLGAYGFRGLIEKKAQFVESIFGALVSLRAQMEEGGLRNYPELERVTGLVCALPRFRKYVREGLKVTVFSFSYKKGYPEDLSGNGGGFMFDCRAMHNPGRYPEYGNLTGLDREVADFLEERGEVQPFLEHCMALVGSAVERYVSRGFSSLQVGFGCTGGQHRSVYCASRLGMELARRFPNVTVEVIHREQGITDKYGNKGNNTDED